MLHLQDFVRDIVLANGSSSSSHSNALSPVRWMPYYTTCNVCQKGRYELGLLYVKDKMPQQAHCFSGSKPDFIMKFDSLNGFDTELSALDEIFGLEEVDGGFEEGLDAPEQVEDLMAQLSEVDVNRLIDLYRMDFEMFRYSPYSYREH